jgi:alanine racemase
MPDLAAQRPTWAEINLENLIHNFRVTRAAVGGAAIMPVVKADAYGHGAVECARALESAGADWFGVALPEEGFTLRQGGITRPILCLAGFWAGQEESIIANRLTPVVFRLDGLDALNREARKTGRNVDYHLKIDTGLGRLGVQFFELEGFLDDATRFESLRLDGVMTHLASADNNDQNLFTEQQIHLFDRAIEAVQSKIQSKIQSRGHRPRWIHAASSAGALAYPRARGNLVRPGGVLYGLWRDVISPSTEPLDWRPVLSLRTRIVLVKTVPTGTPLGYGGTFVTARESRIATIAIGYEDGLRRELSSRGQVIVRGMLAPIIGRVSMDLTLIDVTDVEAASINDEVVIIGSQGEREITAEEVAAQLGTISYEVTCGISNRVPRIYLKPALASELAPEAQPAP